MTDAQKVEAIKKMIDEWDKEDIPLLDLDTIIDLAGLVRRVRKTLNDD